jgi:hypothetical protein
MSKFFGKAADGSYGWLDDAVHSALLIAAAVPVSGSVYAMLSGKNVQPDANGVPVEFVPPLQTLAQVQSAQWVKIKAERDRRQSSGYLVAAKWYHSDDGSRIQQLGLLMMGASIPANLQWKTMDGTFVTMTQALASQVFSAAAASDQVIFAKAEAHKAAMIAAPDPSTYDFSTGWPAVFAG